MAEPKKISSPIEFHAVRNADGTFRVSVLSEVHTRMGADKKKDLGKQETVIQSCRFAATVYGEHETVEIGERRAEYAKTEKEPHTGGWAAENHLASAKTGAEGWRRGFSAPELRI